MKEPRPSEPARNLENGHQERILSAAAELFLEKGFEATCTADIAKRAKVSKRELYSNFRDKRDILAAVITQLQSDIQAQANVSWSSTGELREVLTRAGMQIFEFINSERFGKLFRIVAAESFRDPVSAKKFYHLGAGAGREVTAGFLARQIKAGKLHNVNPLQAADDFLNLVVSARHMTAVVLGQSDDVPQPRAYIKHVVDVFLQYYGTSESAQHGASGEIAHRSGKPVPKTDRVERVAPQPRRTRNVKMDTFRRGTSR